MDCGCLYDDEGYRSHEMIVQEERPAYASEMTDLQIMVITECTAVMNGEVEPDEKSQQQNMSELKDQHPGFDQGSMGMMR